MSKRKKGTRKAAKQKPRPHIRIRQVSDKFDVECGNKLDPWKNAGGNKKVRIKVKNIPGGHLKTGQLWPGQNRPAAGRFLVNHFLYF